MVIANVIIKCAGNIDSNFKRFNDFFLDPLEILFDNQVYLVGKRPTNKMGGMEYKFNVLYSYYLKYRYS